MRRLSSGKLPPASPYPSTRWGSFKQFPSAIDPSSNLPRRCLMIRQPGTLPVSPYPRTAMLGIAVALLGAATGHSQDPTTMTHGPMLGNPTSTTMNVWARTSKPTRYEVRFGTSALALDRSVTSVETTFAHDCATSVRLEGLQSDARYFYQIYIDDLPRERSTRSRRSPIRAHCATPNTTPAACLTSSLRSVAAPTRIRCMESVTRSLPIAP